jgi:ribosomal protein L34E
MDEQDDDQDCEMMDEGELDLEEDGFMVDEDGSDKEVQSDSEEEPDKPTTTVTKVHRKLEIGCNRVTFLSESGGDFVQYVKWPQKTNVKCFSCGNSIHGIPMGIPIKITPTKITLIDRFCGVNCTKKSILKDPTESRMNRRLNLLTQFKLTMDIEHQLAETSNVDILFGTVQTVVHDETVTYSTLRKSLPSLLHETPIAKEKKRRKTMLEKIIKTV